MFLLDGFINLAMTASGYEVPLATDTSLEISIIQSVNNLTPVMQAKIVDTAGLHARFNAFADGAPIEVSIGPGLTATGINKFIRFNMPKVQNNRGADIITFSAQIPQASSLRNLQQKAYSQMPSSAAIAAIAGRIGLPLISDVTSDVMTWLPNNRPIGQWLRHVADHGWASAQSAMHLTSGGRGDGNWSLLYKDVMQAAQSSPMARIVTDGYQGSNDITSWGTLWRSHSGTLNSMLGYNGIVQQVNIQGLTKQFQNVAARLSTASFNMSSAVKGIVADLPRIFLPRDNGNVHKNYAQAEHQNDRLKATFTSFLTVITPDYTNLQVLDPVEAVVYINDQVNATQTGKYVVHSRTQHTSGNMYRELLVLASQGVNAGTGLV